MAQFLVLSKSHKHSKLINNIINGIGDDLSTYSQKAQLLIPNQNARNKMMKAIFYDFVVYESLLKPYKYTSTIMHKKNINNENEIIGYGLMSNHQINSRNSINDDENEYFVFIKLLLTVLKYTLLTPLRIGFSNCFAILLVYYNQYLYNKIIFKSIKQSIAEIDNNNSNENNYNILFRCNSSNIIELDYIMVVNNYRRQKYGTKLIKYLIKQIYDGYDIDGYDDINNNSPFIYIACDQRCLLFYRNLGFEIIGIIDNVYYNRKYRIYSMLYHKNTQKLNLILSRLKQLFAEENTLQINSVGLSFDFSDDNRSNIHFKWRFPPTNIIEFVIYLFKFGILSFFIDIFERVINFNSSRITNYKICQWILQFLFLSMIFLCCVPLFFAIVLLRRFKIGAWD